MGPDSERPHLSSEEVGTYRPGSGGCRFREEKAAGLSQPGNTVLGEPREASWTFLCPFEKSRPKAYGPERVSLQRKGCPWNLSPGSTGRFWKGEYLEMDPQD